MADTSVPVTAGSGTNLHTFSKSINAVTVHDEIMQLGEQYLAAYTVSFTATSTATGSSHLLQVMAGSSLNVYIRRIVLYQLGLATTGAYGQINIVRLSTAGTGGTSVTPAPLDTADSASGCSAMTLPTVKGTEGTVIYRGTAYFNQTAAASMGPPQPLLDVTFDLLRMKALRIPAGTANGIAISQITAIAGATILPFVQLVEANF